MKKQIIFIFSLFISGSALAIDVAPYTKDSLLAAQCNTCHLLSDLKEKSSIPMIKGMSKENFVKRMENFKTANDGVMKYMIKGLTDAEIASLSEFYSKTK